MAKGMGEMTVLTNWKTALAGGCLLGSLITAGAGRNWLPVTSGDGNTKIPPQTPSSIDMPLVHALGRLEPSGRVLQITPEAGNEGATVRQLLVAEGDDVGPGEILAILGNQAQRQARCMEAEAGVRMAEAELLQLQAGPKAGDIEAAVAALKKVALQIELASSELERAELLFSRQAISIEELQLIRTRNETLRADEMRGTAELAALREIRAVDVAVLERKIRVAEAALQVADAVAETSTVRAPLPGRVLRIHTQSGERFNGGAILELGDVSKMHAVAEVFEGDISQVSEGSTARVVMDASGMELQGTVVQVGQLVARKVVLTNDPVSDTDARVVEVRIALTAASSALVEGLSNSRVEVFINPRSDEIQETPSLPRNSSATDNRTNAVSEEQSVG